MALIAAPGSLAASGPSRLVTLDWTATEIALSLGISPAGCAEISGYRTWVDVANEGLADAIDVGRRQQPSLEAVRKLQPDLILTSRYRHASIAHALSEIAPVHLIDDQENGGDMLASVYQSARQAGAALSRSDDVARLLGRFDDEIENLKSRHAGQVAGRKLVVAQPLPGVPRLRVFAPNAAISGLLRKIGFADGIEMSPQPFGFTTIDLEGIASLGSDSTLFILGETVPADLLNASLWPMLPVVAQGNVRLTGMPSWPFGSTASLQHLARQIVTRFV
ncbi:ABC transporter substrate-binding protein [Agrobacterium pusense]|uniref:ABC transporter substrate-binding protein n=1 Tax=Agrobacterium pusense TaxID=648995 RepID=UPI001F1DC052|nr:iron-siderophore ABC transporter substrate-binding protein [Agrobacterium pusense]